MPDSASLVARLEAAEKKYQEYADSVEILRRTAEALVTEHDFRKIAETVTDAGKAISHAYSGAFFYAISADTGNFIVLHALSGMAREVCADFVETLEPSMFIRIFNGKGSLRIDDLALQPPLEDSTLPQCLQQGDIPMRSCLAVPVVSRSGEILGGLFYCHGEPAFFTKEAEKSLIALASQATVSIETAELYNSLQKEIRVGNQREEDARKFAAIVKSSNDAIISKNLNSIVMSWNASAERMFGYTAEEMIGKPITVLIPENHQNEEPEILGRIQRGQTINHYETVRRRKDGSLIQISLTVSPIKDANGTIVGASKIARDITDINFAQEQLRQAQKMEVVGRLAGGIAHDFNNLLTSINGFTEMALAETAKDSTVAEYLEEIGKSGKRAAALTQQLLAYSRKQILAPKILDLNGCITEIEKMLRRLIGEDILFYTLLDPLIGPVRADPAQIQQIIMNLVLNARDAMPDGGSLRIETANVNLESGHIADHPDASPGPHAMLSVSDSGVGMTPEILAQIFEPFFTTKEIGKGTGLGLSSVYGIVKQSGGSIEVTSKPMKGTSFKLYFPLVNRKGMPNKEEQAPAVAGRSFQAETILLAEDEPAVRKFLSMTLKNHGYKVVEAGDGVEALKLAGQTERLDLLITDVIMPNMNGGFLAGELKLIHPKVKLLFISGYTRDALVSKESGNPEIAFLQKPFSPADLISKVREILAVGVHA
ncbi:MAG: PAS domain S-box protein [Fibrobacteria bacterium]